MAKKDCLLLWELIGQQFPESEYRLCLCWGWKVESCSWTPGDMVSVADELIPGLTLWWKTGEMTEAMASHMVADLLHPAKIFPTPASVVAQLCEVTQQDTSGNRSRWKNLVQIIFEMIRHHFCWQWDRVWQEREEMKEGQQWRERVELFKWHHTQMRTCRPEKPKPYI